MIDFEASGGSYTIAARASDGSLNSASVEFTINVTNAAPATPTDNNSADTEVAEAAEQGTTVGLTALALDPGGGTVTYELTSDAGGRFEIDPDTGVVTVAEGAVIDFESSGGEYAITVRASDGLLTASANFTIDVVNVAPATPTDDNAADNEVTEGAANGTAVGITGLSTDPAGGTITYSLTDDAGGRFQINSSMGVVTVANGASIDFESSGGSYTITAQANDGTLNSNTVNFTISVSNAAPATPTDANGSANVVNEGANNGTTVGITVASTDLSGGTITYSLTDSADGRFQVNSSTGVVSVADGSILDFESSGGSYSITARASDGDLTADANFTITVNNVAPAIPTDGDEADDKVNENPANGTTVGLTASSIDPGGSSVTYTLTNDAGGRFQIDPSTGVVSVADGSLLDFEAAGSHTITVRASDGLLAASANFTIGIDDVNEAPVLKHPGNWEISIGNYFELQMVAYDPDGDELSFDAVGLPPGLSINTVTGLISGTVDLSASGTYPVQIRVTDGTLEDSVDPFFQPTVQRHTVTLTGPGVLNTSNGAPSVFSFTVDASGYPALQASVTVLWSVIDPDNRESPNPGDHPEGNYIVDDELVYERELTINLNNGAGSATEQFMLFSTSAPWSEAWPAPQSAHVAGVDSSSGEVTVTGLYVLIERAGLFGGTTLGESPGRTVTATAMNPGLPEGDIPAFTVTSVILFSPTAPAIAVTAADPAAFLTFTFTVNITGTAGDVVYFRWSVWDDDPDPDDMLLSYRHSPAVIIAANGTGTYNGAFTLFENRAGKIRGHDGSSDETEADVYVFVEFVDGTNQPLSNIMKVRSSDF